MSKKLLNKTLKSYAIYSTLMMLAISPVFYFVSLQIYIHEADEALILRKNEFLKNSIAELTYKDISIWNNYSRDVKIESDKNLLQDSLFDTFYYDTLVSENEPYRELNSPIQINGIPYTFVAKINLVEREDLIGSIAILFLILIISFVTGFYFITKKMSTTLWKPFYQILNQIENFEIDKTYQLKSDNTGIEEFNRLNQSIQSLIVKNTSIYKSQREFIENASHELQTPLAVFQAKVDTLIQSPETTEEQFKELNSLNENISKLKRLNKNLLLLSRLENDDFLVKKQINFNDIVEKNKTFFNEQARAKNISINVEFEGLFQVHANQDLSEILISNLILNAIRHNKPNGVIQIRITNQEFKISNSGESIPLNQERIFSRFAKGNSSKHGNGLGLAIVKKIATLNKWEIQYHFINDLHNFSIIFSPF